MPVPHHSVFYRPDALPAASILNYFGVAFAVFHLAGVVMGFKAPKIKK